MSTPPRLLFVHVPKTAGTSFKLGLAAALGEKHCCFDYGAKSRDTSPLVREHIYRDPDYFRFGQEFKVARGRLLAGHFGYLKYGPLFQARGVLGFCRHPQQQLMSHYSHFVRHNDYRGTLEQFLHGPFGGGLQSRVFKGLHLAAYGFIGVTERYDESLRVLRETMGIEIEPGMQNVNPDKTREQPYCVPPEVAASYERAVQRDLGTYQLVNNLLDARLAALDEGYPYVHGAIQAATSAVVMGFAFCDDAAGPVTVELVVNGQCVASRKAVGDRPGLRHANVPRNAYVGFEFRRPGLLTSGDKIEVRVASTGQVLDGRIMDVTQEGRAR